MNVSTWKNRINELAEIGEPFLCMIDFEMLKPIIVPLSQIDPVRLKYHFNGKRNFDDCSCHTKKIKFKKQPVTFEVFKACFDAVQQHLLYGNSFLLNLTFPTQIETNLSLHDIFCLAKQPYKLWFKDELVVFSPEKFIVIEDDKVNAYPMKGTIDASLYGAEETIMENKKEAAEHATIVDLIRNDLSTIANQVRVKRYRYIEKIQTNQKDLLQVSSHIQGTLPSHWQKSLGDMLLKLLPAGSISGAPKQKTLEIIESAELEKRGYYTGIMGIFDGVSFDSAVMIRFVEQQKNKMVFRSGGGITAQSNATDEYHEMIDKVYFPWHHER